LKKNEKLNKSFPVTDEKTGQRAELHYTNLFQLDNYTLLEVELMTGRHHQIRVQLAAIGHPIKGDLKYGAVRSNEDHSISLMPQS
jgi:23S rRNA pseudouridine1911/1915/1917 synthase